MTDVVQRRRMIEEGEAPDEIKRIERGKLEALLALCETAACRRQTHPQAFRRRAIRAIAATATIASSPAETWDGTEAAIKVLAAIYRTGQRFGAGHIVDVLVGRETEKVLSNGHHTQPVFGKGEELDARGWQSVLRQLTAMGLVIADVKGFGGLALGEGARAVFRHERTVTLRKDQPRRAAETRRVLAQCRRAATGGRSAVRCSARRAQPPGARAIGAALCDLPRRDAQGHGDDQAAQPRRHGRAARHRQQPSSQRYGASLPRGY